jgi:hypothetical protein
VNHPNVADSVSHHSAQPLSLINRPNNPPTPNHA